MSVKTVVRQHCEPSACTKGHTCWKQVAACTLPNKPKYEYNPFY